MPLSLRRKISMDGRDPECQVVIDGKIVIAVAKSHNPSVVRLIFFDVPGERSEVERGEIAKVFKRDPNSIP